ncbi:MAG TPA: ethanolamine ammonia-lyase subunit EutC [Acetobacteraceae bacterium]|nr:ethanolamine ammonia-lyase subunit EutC [Acetobacteraceae bacterium]
MAEPPDVWAAARSLTPARIGLRRAGASLATAPSLAFRLAHARARDAVHAELDVDRLTGDLSAIPLQRAPVVVDSAARDRQTYLLRPDLGRRLSPDTEAHLLTCDCDLAVVVADGLSARAAQTHAAPLLAVLIPMLQAESWAIAPLAIVRNGRVAIGDAIAARLGAAGVLVLIGERPGLSAPDSLGAYLTWGAGPQTTDANRNCLSNIRPEGMPSAEAARRIALLLGRMRQTGYSGVALKDEAEVPPRLG